MLILSTLSIFTYLYASTATYYAFILPNDIPSDSAKANAVIDFLIELNKIVHRDDVVAYWLITNGILGKTFIPAGTIIITAPEKVIASLIDIARKGNLEVFELKDLPQAQAIIIKPVKIGVLDYGISSTLLSVLKTMGFNYTMIPNSSIINLLTEDYDLFILPPGSGTKIARALGVGGSKIVAEFVYRGGGLIGICAGAYAAVKGYNDPTTWIQLVDAKVRNYPTWALGGGIVTVRIEYPENPVMFGFRGEIKMIYWNGPVLEPFDLGSNTTLGIDIDYPVPLAIFVKPSNKTDEFIPGWGGLEYSYVVKVMKDGYAITYSRYGLGKIVLFSTHPELVIGPSETPAAKLESRYRWRMLWQAIYFVAGKRVLLGAIVGIWMWPSALRYTYQMVLEEFYEGKELSLRERVEAFTKACRILAEELASYGITDVFLEVKLLSGTLIFPSDIGSKYGVKNPYPAEPYNITDVVKVFANALHEKGIRLHAWIIVHYDRTWGAKDPIYHCGRWENATYFTGPYPRSERVRLFNLEYQEYIAELAKELVAKHGVDGIHLDYIRWPHAVYSFSPRDFELAKEKGIDLHKVWRYVIITFYGMPNESIHVQPDLIFRL